MQAPKVTVEVHLANGLPAFNIVGLPETSVKEAKERVRSALITSRFEFPDKRITVNLAPADLPKEGGRFDLPIAIGILVASGQIPGQDLTHLELIGELALSGALRPVSGAISAALAATEANHAIAVPLDDAPLATRIPQSRVYGISSLSELAGALAGQQSLSLSVPHMNDEDPDQSPATRGDYSDVIGQSLAKRALEIAAAGNHNLLMLGPPGTGKTMLASRLPTILPPLTDTQAIEVAAIHSVSQQTGASRAWRQPPYRSPHHSASMVALVGGGSNPRPGEISLAHHGVLFLDEMPEFPRQVLDSLRQPLESGEVHISRASRSVSYPARFQLIGALNPSPCGYYQGSQVRSNPDQILRYLGRLSGPFLDRFDLSVEVTTLPKGALSHAAPSESSRTIRQRVVAARERQWQRSGKLNHLLSGKELAQFAPLSQADSDYLETAIERLGLSTRAYHRIWRVARTIADLNGQDQVTRSQLTEALGYRAMERLLGQLNRP
jgi:magnesium chelatase family protein